MQSKTTTDGSGEVIAVFACAAGFVLVAWAAIGLAARLIMEAAR